MSFILILMRWLIFIILGIFIILAVIFFFGGNDIKYNEETRSIIFDIPKEKSFYKKSDLGTDVMRLTNASGNDGIFYQEPNYFSDNGKYFLFKSERDGKDRLMVIDLESGNMTFIKKTRMYGWAPAWNDNKVYVGDSSKIIIIDIENYEESKIDLPDNVIATFIHFNPAGDKMVFVEEIFGEHKSLSVINVNGTGYKKLFILDKEKEFYLDHPTFINDYEILFLTRGEERNFSGDFNKPYVINLEGIKRRLPLDCSHYGINSNGDKIICASEGYIIDL